MVEIDGTNDHLGEQCDRTHLVNNQVAAAVFWPGLPAITPCLDRCDNEVPIAAASERNNCSVDVFCVPRYEYNR